MDSPDLSLNISREILQHDRQLGMIRANIEKKIRKELETILADDRDKYLEFYKSFGTQLKYGIVEDYGANSDIVKDLVMFHSMAQDRLITLKEYKDSMAEGQEKIYYASAESISRAKQLPQAEQVRDKGYDILCMTEDVDEFAIRTLRAYDEKEFCDISGNDLGIETEEEKKEADEKESSEKEILDFVKETLGDKVSSVKLSRKLKSHAVCLSTEGDVSLEMEKYFASIPGGSDINQIKAKRILEINGSHPAFESLKKAYEEDRDKAKDMANIMYVQALLIAGMPVDDIMEYSDLVFKFF